MQAIPLISIGVLSSLKVVSSIVPSVVSSGWCSIPIDVHGDGGVVHPSRGVGRVILRHVLSLGTIVVPLRAWLLGSKGSKIPVSSEYVSE